MTEPLLAAAISAGALIVGAIVGFLPPTLNARAVRVRAERDEQRRLIAELHRMIAHLLAMLASGERPPQAAGLSAEILAKIAELELALPKGNDGLVDAAGAAHAGIMNRLSAVKHVPDDAAAFQAALIETAATWYRGDVKGFEVLALYKARESQHLSNAAAARQMAKG